MGKTGVGRLLDMGPQGVLGISDMDAHAHRDAHQDEEQQPQGTKDYACATRGLCAAEFRRHADDMVWRELPPLGRVEPTYVWKITEPRAKSKEPRPNSFDSERIDEGNKSFILHHLSLILNRRG